ncbi:hypothetical protein IWX46DRAFT_591164 [Phyllosticta citricarpa]|uniref:Uncharacterized protein n=1 Tax=Phyllosticta citricarpa TaxID=55181 RepID=A0ABR1MMP8_9PEZI
MSGRLTFTKALSARRDDNNSQHEQDRSNGSISLLAAYGSHLRQRSVSTIPTPSAPLPSVHHANDSSPRSIACPRFPRQSATPMVRVECSVTTSVSNPLQAFQTPARSPSACQPANLPTCLSTRLAHSLITFVSYSFTSPPPPPPPLLALVPVPVPPPPPPSSHSNSNDIHESSSLLYGARLFSFIQVGGMVWSSLLAPLTYFLLFFFLFACLFVC